MIVACASFAGVPALSGPSRTFTFDHQLAQPEERSVQRPVDVPAASTWCLMNNQFDPQEVRCRR